jgi:hypothetical protein
LKTTIEIPDSLFRRANSAAAERGIPLADLVAEALAEKLSPGAVVDKPWMRTFGELRHLHEETNRINDSLESEFEDTEPEDIR